MPEDTRTKVQRRLYVWRLAESIDAERVCEVGVWRGELAVGLFQIPCTKHVLLIDPWKVEHLRGAITSEHDQDELDKMADKLERMAGEWSICFETGFDIWRTTSLEAARKVPNASLDLVHIDADHRYDAVKADIAAWYPKLRSGGILCGDDYDKEQVAAAVDEELPGALIHDDRVWSWRV